MRSQKELFAPRLRFLIGKEQSVLRIARGMVRRKVQRLEIVVIGFDHRAFGNGISEVLEDGDNLVLRADDWVLGANGAANAGKGNVERLLCRLACWLCERSLDSLLDL